MHHWIKHLVTALCALSFALPALGGKAESATHSAANTASIQGASLRPYTAQYKTTARGMALKLTRKLKLSADGYYTLTNGGKIMVAGFHEVSVFSTMGAEIVPKSYVYQGTGLINRRREVHFTPGSDLIRSLYKGSWYDLRYTQGTLDRMSQQEHLRLLLLNSATPQDDIAVRIADGKRVKDYLLRYVAEETLQTPMGELQTLHFERLHDDPDRTSDMWLAPELDYLIVKTVHVEDNKPIEMLLTQATIEGGN